MSFFQIRCGPFSHSISGQVLPWAAENDVPIRSNYIICLDKVIHNWGLSHLWMGEVATIIDHRANGTHLQMASVINRSWNTSSSRYLLGELTYPRGGPLCSCGRLPLNPYQGALRRDSSKHQIRGEERNDIISPYFPYDIPILVVSYVDSKKSWWLVVCFVHQVWKDAIDLSQGRGHEAVECFFHYTSELGFRNITNTKKDRETGHDWAGETCGETSLYPFIGKPVDQILGPAIYIYIHLYDSICMYIYNISLYPYVYYIYNNHSDRIWIIQKVPSLNWPYLWHFHGLFQDDYTCFMFPFGLPKSRGRCWDFRPSLRERLEVHSVRHIPNGFAFLCVFVIFCYEWYKHLY